MEMSRYIAAGCLSQPGETSPVWSPAGRAIGYTRLSRRGQPLAAPPASDAWIARLLPNR